MRCQQPVDLVLAVREGLAPVADGGVLAVMQHLLAVHREHVVHDVAQVAVSAPEEGSGRWEEPRVLWWGVQDTGAGRRRSRGGC